MQAMPSSKRDHVFDTAGTYGPVEGKMSVEGNVVVDAAKVTLQNMDIAGNLIFTDKLGAGDAVLQNVRVAGTAFVYGGGEHSIHVRDSDIKALTIDKKGSRVRILASGSSVITNTSLLSSAILEESEGSGTGFTHVMLSEGARTESDVWLRGSFDTVTMSSSKWKLSLQRGSINTLRIGEASLDSSVYLEDGTNAALVIIDTAAIFSGKGMIKKAELNANGIQFERSPESVSCASGVTHNLCQQQASSSSGSSGGSSSPPPSSTVTALEYEPLQVKLNYLGQEIQAKVTARWSDGETRDVTSKATWSSQDTAIATVSREGKISAAGEGQTNVEVSYRGSSVRIPVEVITTSPVTGAYQVESLLTPSSPVAGEANMLRLIVQRSDGSTDTAFNGRKKVAVSGFSKASDGTIGQWNGVSINDTVNEYEVDFTDGEASVSLILHHAVAHTIVFTVADVVEPDARQVVTPSPAEAHTAFLQTQPSPLAVSGERLAEQPVIVLRDRFLNVATNSALAITASISGSDSGSSTVLHGTTVIPAVNGIASFTDLYLQGRGSGVIITFVPAGLAGVDSDPISVRIPFAGGAGTKADPYVINTAEQLDAMRYDLQSHFMLNNDIDLNVAPYNQGEGWQPIGTFSNRFTGSLDGGGHVITGLTINRQSDATNAGLFGFASNADIRNLQLKNVYITNHGNGVGGLAGTIWYGTVENVSVHGTVMAKASLIGGVVGDFLGTMRYVYADVSVEGENNVGGLIGLLSGEGYGSWLERSYSRGTVKSTVNAVGGLGGWIERDCIVADSYSLAEIIGVSITGGVAGNVLGDVRNSFAAGKVSTKYNDPEGGIAGFVPSSGKVIGSYYDRETTTKRDYGNGEPKYTTDMKKQSTFVNWDFTGIWAIDEGNSYPYLQWPDALDTRDRLR